LSEKNGKGVDEMAVAHEGEPVLAPDEDHETVRELNDALAKSEGVAHLVAPSGEKLELPHSIYNVLRRVVDEMAKGNAVKVMPLHAELTTQEAADLLNVSRPFLVSLLEKGEMPYQKVGTHRRVRLEDLLVYRDHRDSERRRLLDEIASESQELGLYDEEDDE
jgi:excisionase family DNA binding protein